jgi:dTDP-4-dehydrorhamnose reductase
MEQVINKKIFLTGANGFIGRKVAANLADFGYAVTAIVREKKWEHPNIKFIESDLFGIDKLNINKSEFDFVIHMAAFVGMHERGGKLRRENYDLTNKLLDYFKNSPVYFIYFSSIEAFGPTTENVVSEDDAPCPVTDYGIIKLKTEGLVKKSGIKYSILRVGNAESECGGLMYGIKNILSKNDLCSRFQSFIFSGIINDYELNIINIGDITRTIKKIINLKPENQLYFLTQERIRIGKICGQEKGSFCFLLPFLILFGKIISVFKISHIILYITEGGLKRKFRNYSNQKITSSLGIKF